MTLEENVPLAPLTTFRIGGAARFFLRARSFEELQEGLAYAREQKLPIFILGGGSNLLVSDEGWPGLVIKIELQGTEVRREEKRALLIAAAGENWDGVVARAVGEGLWGLENLSGIPGTVGGAVVQNIGAYGAAVSESLAWVEVLDAQSGEVKRLGNAQCCFDYRDSLFKHDENLVVLRAAFTLQAQGNPNLSYKDLREAFPEGVASLAEVRKAVLAIRAGKFPDLAKEGTAGSFFKNPIVSRAQALEFQARYPGMPIFDIPESSGVKVPLAWLIDKGLGLKGFSSGAARLYEKQPLVVAAHFGASSSDVRALIDAVRAKVYETFGIELDPEVKVL